MQSVIVIALVGLASALPFQASTSTTTVALCTGENYTGECTSLTVPFNACQPVPPAFAGNVGSFEVADGAYCRIT